MYSDIRMRSSQSCYCLLCAYIHMITFDAFIHAYICMCRRYHAGRWTQHDDKHHYRHCPFRSHRSMLLLLLQTSTTGQVDTPNIHAVPTPPHSSSSSMHVYACMLLHTHTHTSPMHVHVYTYTRNSMYSVSIILMTLHDGTLACMYAWLDDDHSCLSLDFLLNS